MPDTALNPGRMATTPCWWPYGAGWTMRAPCLDGTGAPLIHVRRAQGRTWHVQDTDGTVLASGFTTAESAREAGDALQRRRAAGGGVAAVTIPLLAECALPGCVNPSDTPGAPCPECAVLFDGSAGGFTIRRAVDGDAVAETAEDVTARKAATLAAQARAATPERKPNQTCWLCEARRTCTLRPDGWECDTCRATGTGQL